MARTGRTVCKEACCCPENPDELFAPLVWSVAAGFNSFFQFTSLFLLPLIFSLSSLHFSLLPSRQATDFHRALCSFAFYARTAHLTRTLCLKGGTSCLPRCLRSELFFKLLSAHGRLHWDRLSNKLVIDDLHAHYTMKAHVKARLSRY